MKIKNTIKDFSIITVGTAIVAVAVFFFMLPSHVSVGSGTALAMVYGLPAVEGMDWGLAPEIVKLERTEGGILLTVRRGYGDASASPADCVRGKKVALLGAGGAARSAALSLKNAGAELTILNRTLSSAEALRTMLQTPCECLALTEENTVAAAKSCDILINCTAAGMAGQPDFASLAFIDALPSHAMVIDAVYNPLETTLLKKAAARGLTAMSGLWMLVYQGALAFEKWSGVLPDEDACARAFDLIK